MELAYGNHPLICRLGSMSKVRKGKRKPLIPRPDLVRRIENSFGWVDHRLLRRGHLQRLALEDIALYLFLVLAADRHGVSYYHKEKICTILRLSWDQFESARHNLIEKGLIAFRPFTRFDVNGFYQLLPLPESPNA